MQGANNVPFDSVFGQYQIPYPQMPAGAHSTSTYYASPWVGLLDDAALLSTDRGVIVQAGDLIKGINGRFKRGGNGIRKITTSWTSQSRLGIQYPSASR